MAVKVYETYKEAEMAYSDYVHEHIEAIQTMFEKFGKTVCVFLYNSLGYGDGNIYDGQNTIDEYMAMLELIVKDHDKSKYSDEEWEAYRMKFYPCKEEPEPIASLNDKQKKNMFKEAWYHHYTHNPHHPEHWAIPMKHWIEDVGDDRLYVQMPFVYLCEMVLDWLAMSYTRKQNLQDWWFSPGGYKEKEPMLGEKRTDVLTNLFNDYREEFDFSKL